MTNSNRDTVIQDGTAITGNLLNGGKVEIRGYIEGEVSAKHVFIHEKGKLYGTLNAQSARIGGIVQGLIKVKQLLTISESGAAIGTVEYGALAMDPGGELSADVRNVPPEVAGDLKLEVHKGGQVALTPADLTALDPDDIADDLVFTVSNAKNGFVALASSPHIAVTRFTQADVIGGRVSFTHDSSASEMASFDVVVVDASGANSGPAKTVSVEIIGQF